MEAWPDCQADAVLHKEAQVSQHLIRASGDIRLVQYNTPYPPLYEIWVGDQLIFSSYWESSANRKYRSLTIGKE
jgi:hypothetical protein